VTRGQTLLSRLARGEPILLDGATGSELQRRGVNVSRGTSVETGSGAWSATAIEEAPEVVCAIHEDYLRIGVDVITANSYATNRGRLARIGLGHRMAEFSRRAVEIARDARDRIAPKACVAGSLGPTTAFPDLAPRNELSRDWRDQVAVLAEAGVDLILIELMSAVAQLLPAVEAASGSGLPILLGIRVTSAGRMFSGETMEQLVAALEDTPQGVDAVLLMCSAPDAISASLPGIATAFKGPVGAYANIGYRQASHTPGRRDRPYYEIDVGDNTPGRYAEYGRTWRALGAQLIGGCCGTTPDHIAALCSVVRAA
jgi:S-methylmethionine-dependent homocysteine/selenocysteine methylase